MEWPASTVALFESEMDKMEAEERIVRIADAQMANGRHVEKHGYQQQWRKLERRAFGTPQEYRGPKVDPMSPEGKAKMQQMGFPVVLVDRHGRPIENRG